MGALALLMPVIQEVISLIPDPTQRAKSMQAIIDACQQVDAAQNAVNAEEAKNENVFVSGWRPFIGWVCGSAFAYKFLLQPFLIFALVASGSDFDYNNLPVLDWSEMSSILLGMLGLGTMRTVEKLGNAGKMPWQK